jgi:hypothetical protein
VMAAWHGNKDRGLGSVPTTVAGSTMMVSAVGWSGAGAAELQERV